MQVICFLHVERLRFCIERVIIDFKSSVLTKKTFQVIN